MVSLFRLQIDQGADGYMRGSAGDMIYFEVLGQPFLILGSLNKVQDLFERRSAIYSSRPHMPMVMDLYVLLESLRSQTTPTRS